MSRAVTHRYVDPLAEVWLGAARTIGLRVERQADAYASTDGRGTLVIGTADTLDTDDSLAQMIFHELCHSLVQGEDSFARADWGLDNQDDHDHWREHATLRLQSVLAARYGLRGFFAPTTDFRSFWDALPADPLADRADPSVVLAIAGLRRVATPPWGPTLEDALAATAAIVATASRWAAATSGEPTSLAAGFVVPPPHPTGLPAGPTIAGRTCGGCAWKFVGGPGRKATRCRQAGGAVIDESWPGCERHEPALDCQDCGACCREAYHAVAVAPRDPVRTRQPTYVADRGVDLGAGRYEMCRAGDRCAALTGGEPVATPSGPSTTRFQCVIYDDRPRTCRDFTASSANCLTARRRVGRSL